MSKKLNRKGFTLVELLAVLVILVAIMGIAIPTISSSLERTKEKQNQARYKVLESAAELYITDNKNVIYDNLGDSNKCYISVSALGEYLTENEMKDADGDPIMGGVIFTRADGEEVTSYQYSETNTVSLECK